ncbi:hypothetical protein KFL_000520140 [Klebsormidium nitens]|uniref:N-acetyltransferase domain-containing protein n=1 Tax=Klebsormidium nitens TaxID=105231 RepID=A0A1Y1HQI9_KLENI|nr:hypothetical protein KFL_000520140 [Klebsormidium nitens]|eukprot:GAQ80343.1 hypothetical protein KFL_000520140 [Klebsormidium nitens]
MAPSSAFSLRPLEEADIPAAAEVACEAFNSFNETVGLPPEVPSPDPFVEVIAAKLRSPLSFSVLAVNREGQPIGSNFIVGDPDSKIWTMGPVNVSTKANSAGVGRAIVKACVDHAEKEGAKSLRLVQLTSNPKAFSLYTKFGFDPKFVAAYFEGYPSKPLEVASGYTVRRLEEGDIPGCDALFLAPNGYSFAKTLSGFTKGWPFPMFVALKDGEVVAYTTAFLVMGHVVAKDEDAFVALFSGASAQLREMGAPPPTFHLPVAIHPELCRWCLSVGLKLVRHTWIMVKGEFKELPREPLYCPSIDWH